MPELSPMPGPIPAPRAVPRTPAVWGLLGPGPGALAGLYLLTVTVTAGPELSRDLNLTGAMVAVATVGYLVAGVVGAPAGWLLGRPAPDAVAVIGPVLILFGAALDAFTPAFPLLMIGRVVSGLAAGALVATTVVLARRAGNRPAYGIGAAAALLALIVGAALGALLTSALSWRTPFLLAVPAALVALVAAIAVAATGAARR